MAVSTEGRLGSCLILANYIFTTGFGFEVFISISSRMLHRLQYQHTFRRLKIVDTIHSRRFIVSFVFVSKFVVKSIHT